MGVTDCSTRRRIRVSDCIKMILPFLNERELIVQGIEAALVTIRYIHILDFMLLLGLAIA